MTRQPLAAALADRYRIERELGQGGMATVYLAQDLKHDRLVALKVLKPELAAVLGAERFVVEIKTTASLSHPHILPLFDSGTADGFLFYVMPYIDGETLRSKLDRETQLSVEEAVRITREVADALDYAHRHGVIHRDIKPENILLNDGRPMVADFGIALAVSAAAGGRMTETGLSLGTPHYMSPEQATAEKELSARSDIYSLGCVLYEMLTGNPPHTGASAQQIIMKIVTEDAAPVTKLRRAVPPNVAAAVARAVERLPADRFESAATFAEALSNPMFAYGSLGPQPHRIGADSASGRRAALLHLVATVTLGVGLVWALLARGTPAPESRTSWVSDLGLPDSAGYADGLALSPDGSLLLYGSLGPVRQILVRRAGSLVPAAIAGTSGGCCPALSPDGQRVAFVLGGELRVIPLGGGSSTLLGTGILDNDDVAWTADGHLVAVGLSGGLIRVAEAGGPVTPFTTPDTAAGERAHWSPRALPDGRGVIFSIVPLDPADSVGIRIGVVGPGGGTHAVLLPGRVAAYAHPGHLLVLRNDGTIVAAPFDLASLRITGAPVPAITGLGSMGFTTWLGYFAVARTGMLVYVGGTDPHDDLVWVRRTGAVAEMDSSETSRILDPSHVSTDGRFVAFESVIDDRSGIDVRDRQTGASSRIELTTGTVDRPSVSADGRSLVFRALAPEGRGIYRAELGRLAERTLLTSDPRATAPSLSPDSRTVYFVRAGARSADFIARSLAGSDTVERVLAGSVNPSSTPRISPDGRWLAYLATVSGSDQLYLRSTEAGRTERWQVARAGAGGVTAGSALRWSRDGRELYFVSRDSMVAVHLSGGEALTVGLVETLFSMQPYQRDFDVTSDGRFVLINRRLARWRLMLVEDWRALLGTH